MSSKAKRPTTGDKLVRVKDLLAMNRAWLVRIEGIEAEIIKLKESRETPATTGTPCS